MSGVDDQAPDDDEVFLDVNEDRWLMRKDENFISVPIASKFQNREDTRSVAALQAQLTAAMNRGKPAKGKVWLSVPVRSMPSEVAACMAAKTLRTLLSEEGIIISILSTSGYSFSSEYLYLYKGTFRSVRAFEDLTGVMQKAVKSLDPTVTEDKALLFASYIIRRAAWLTQYYVDILHHNLLSHFVDHEAMSTHKRFDFDLVRVFLFREESSGELGCHMRLENTIYFKDKDLSVEELHYQLVCYQTLHMRERHIHLFEDVVLSRASDKPARIDVDEHLSGPAGSLRLFLVPVSENFTGDPEDPAEDTTAEAGDPVATITAEEAESTWSRLRVPDSPLCADLLGWGLDAYDCLALPSPGAAAAAEAVAGQRIISPRPVPLPRGLLLERVAMIACSARHTLLLTQMGNLFGCGDNSEGALGLGDLLPRSSFTPVEWPASFSRPCFVAAGAGLLGCHSMALDAVGGLYGWGVARALGLGSVKPVLVPTVVTVKAWTTDFDAEVSQPVRFVACGDTFTVCVTALGHVYSWGQWSHGRLGLGPVPTVASTNRRATGTKLAKYQLSPLRVPHVFDAVEVACGAAHVLCVTRSGVLLAWGQNSLGQLGTGPTRQGQLRDAFFPVVVPQFGPIAHAPDFPQAYLRLLTKDPNPAADLQNRSSEAKPLARRAFCGSYHSICLDSEGGVHSWGARGSPCLGTGDSVLEGDWGRRVNSVFSLSTQETSVMVPFELLKWASAWSMPRRVEALRGKLVTHCVAGDLSTAFLADRKVYLCGGGPVVPAFDPPGRMFDTPDDADGEEEAAQGQPPAEGDPSAPISAVLVATPRTPSSCWLREVSTRQVHYISGTACHLFAWVDEESCSALTQPLYRALIKPSTFSRGLGPSEANPSDEASVDSGRESELLHAQSDPTSERFRGILEDRGRADCMVITSGYIFLAHKALLAQRSPVLREMIVMETPTDSSTTLVQVLLPELHKDAARSFFFFLYTDSLPLWACARGSLLHTLARAAQTLRMPRMKLLCDHYLLLLTGGSSVADMPPRTLSMHLGALLGDPEFSDVRFIAEGRAIAAHRFVLEGRCEYFRAMFRGGLSEGALGTRKAIDVVVPDSFVGFLRLLIFVYTHTLPDGGDGALLEDLMAADRYGLPDLAELCVQMLAPSATNWLDLLRAADLLHLPALHASVLLYLRGHFDALHSHEELREEFPQVYEELVLSRAVFSPSPPSALLLQQTVDSKLAVSQAEQRPFPFHALALMLVCGLGYQQLGHVIDLGVFIPIVNVVACGAFVLYVTRTLM